MGTHQELLRLVGELIAFHTVSQENDSTRQIASCIALWLREHGFVVQELPYQIGRVEKVNLVAQKGEGDPWLALSGHMDTVSASLADWEGPKEGPFQLTLQDGKYYGRGSADMKLFLALAMVAGAEIDAAELEHPFALYFTSDEEIGCVGVSQLFGIGSDGQRTTTVPVPKYVVIGEPTEMTPIHIHKGYMFLRVTLHGITGHSSTPDVGRSVVKLALSPVVQALNRVESRLRFITDPGTQFEPAFPTLNQGVVSTGPDAAKNKIAGKCDLDIEIRPVPGQDVMEMFRVMQLAVEGAVRGISGITATVASVRPFTPPMVTQVSSPVVQLATELSGQRAGAVNYNTEGGLFNSLGAESVVWGPGSIGQAHKNDEYVEARWLDESVVQLYADAIREMCGRRR